MFLFCRCSCFLLFVYLFVLPEMHFSFFWSKNLLLIYNSMIPFIKVQEQAKVIFGNKNQWLSGCGKLTRKGHVGNFWAIEMFSSLCCVVVAQDYTIVRTQLNTLSYVHFIMLIIPHILRTYSVFKIQIIF